MPTNPRNNLSRTKVEESKGSKEFMLDDPEMTVELAHAVRVLDEHFKKQGYDEWILGPVCSRKLMEKVQQRVPNPQYTTAAQEGLAQMIRDIHPAGTVGQYVVDPQPMGQIHEWPAPFTQEQEANVMRHLGLRRERQEGRIIGMSTPTGSEDTIQRDYERVLGGQLPLTNEEIAEMQHAALVNQAISELQEATTVAQENNDGTRGIPTPQLDETPF